MSTNVEIARPKETQSHLGRPSSWLVVAVIIIGFTVGGVALVLGPLWWLFAVGGGVVVVGGLVGWASGIMNDYTT